MKKSFFAGLLAICMLAGNISALAVDAKEPQETYVSDTADAKTVEDQSYGYIEILSPVSGLSIDDIEEDCVTLNWYGGIWSWDRFDYYEIAQYDAETEAYTVFKTVDAEKSTEKIDGLQSGRTYHFAMRKVRAYENGERLESPYTDVTVTTALKAAKITSANYAGRGKITVKWKKVKGTRKYIVEYGTSKGFRYNGRTMYKMINPSKTSITLSKLAATSYYVRVLPCVLNGDRYDFSQKNVQVKSVAVRSGLTLKESLNSINTKDNPGRDTIKKLTNKKVDIAKYHTTYDKVMSIYRWHTAHALEFVHCLACNANFNDCLYAMFGQEYSNYLWIAAGEFKNSSGTRAMHKWSAVYLQGVPYLFDPRMQKYIAPNGTDFFGFGMSSALYKKRYAFEAWYYHW